MVVCVTDQVFRQNLSVSTAKTQISKNSIEKVSVAIIREPSKMI